MKEPSWPRHQIADKLKKTGLPSLVTKTTLINEERPDLRELIATRDFAKERGYRNYWFSPVSHREAGSPTRIAAVFARELVLSGVDAVYAPMARLERETLLYGNTDYRDTLQILPTVGHPTYWIVPDFNNREASRSPAHWHDCLDWIGRHVTDGGALVLATSVKASDWIAELPTILLDQIGEPSYLGA